MGKVKELEMICETCGEVLLKDNYTSSDGEFSVPYMFCPECGKRWYIEGTDGVLEKFTEDNQ